jgi:multicomponent Na+:H+ antiporter subunit B
VRSIVLSTATRFLVPLLLLLSVSLLLRGHDVPGGGFSGGLFAASAMALYVLAAGGDDAVGEPRVEPRRITAAGLLLSVAAGALPLAHGRPFLAGLWFSSRLPLLGRIDVGTPVLFDAGVYLVVAGVTLTIFFSLRER